MKYRNVDNWKTEMKKLSKLRKIDIQDIQQRYVLEEIAEKISLSKYNKMLILIGGFVVSTLLGLDTRMTRDLDVTCKSTIYSLEEMRDILQEVIKTKSESLFSTKDIDVMVYPIENIIAEKYETTLDRGEYNTRIRDLFDIYLLLNENHCLIDKNLLAQTIIEVSKDRDTLENLEDFSEIIDILEKSNIFNKHFQSYREKQYPYESITLKDVLEKFKDINQMIIDYKKMEVISI